MAWCKTKHSASAVLQGTDSVGSGRDEYARRRAGRCRAPRGKACSTFSLPSRPFEAALGMTPAARGSRRSGPQLSRLLCESRRLATLSPFSTSFSRRNPAGLMGATQTATVQALFGSTASLSWTDRLGQLQSRSSTHRRRRFQPPLASTMLTVLQWSTVACPLSGDAFQASSVSKNSGVSVYRFSSEMSVLLHTMMAVPVTPYPIAAIR